MHLIFLILLFPWFVSAQVFDEFSSSSITISNDTTWKESGHIRSDIIIKSGGKLCISADLFLNENAKIIVERGATLIIDGGHITGTCGMWNGIEVWGTTSLPPATSSAHGKVFLKNNAIIENALWGVYATKYTGIPPVPWDINYSGGIISAGSGTTFRNCYIGAMFFPYSFDNWSSFNKVVFETTPDWVSTTLKPDAFIRMSSVKGIPIHGCVFRNTVALNNWDILTRGKGIWSYASDIDIANSCSANQIPCVCALHEQRAPVASC